MYAGGLHLALHLLHGKLCGGSVNVLHEATPLACWDLGVHYVSKSPKKTTEVFFCDTTAEGPDEQCRVVGVQFTQQRCKTRLSHQRTRLEYQ